MDSVPQYLASPMSVASTAPPSVSTTPKREIELGETFVTGDALLARTMDRWMPKSEYAYLDGIEQLPDKRARSFAAE